MAILNNNPLVGASGNQGGYNINNSLRFRASASAYLSRTPASATNRKTWTWSGWVKKSNVTTYNTLFFANAGGNTNIQIQFLDDNTLRLFQQFSGVDSFILVPTQVFRDPSAWYHIVVAVDTTQATSSNRAKMYINGQQVTAFSSATYPSLNLDTTINSTVAHYVGHSPSGPYYLDGYMAEVNFIDGSAKVASDFGETDTTTGVWKPKAYSGTYGTNGFYLKFSDIATTSGSNAGLGKDFSGNSNYWTTNNISVTSGTTYDAMTDVPTNTSATVANYCVLNPIAKSSNHTLSAANLTDTISGSGACLGTFGVTSGKWYWEGYITTRGTDVQLGVANDFSATTSYLGATTASWGVICQNGNRIYNASQSSYGSAYADGDTFMIALDMDNGKWWAGKNGTWFASGDPAAGTNPAHSGLTGTMLPAIGSNSTSGNHSFNFGQRAFTYTPPTGFVALNTYNLPTPTILQGNKYMDATLYTGTGSAQTIVNAGAFKPDAVWIKARNAAEVHMLTDSVRGVNSQLIPNLTDAQYTRTDQITSLNNNGFSLGIDGAGWSNTNARTYVGWQWQAGQGTTSSNTSGSITSTTSVNATAGFSIVTYTGTGANATVGHGLGVAPAMYIVKQRSATGDWFVYHKNGNASPQGGGLFLNLTNAWTANTSYWNNTQPTSSVFSIGVAGGLNANGVTQVAYCFAEIAGFSKFGSYTGNGSTDGPFVFTGFRPKFIMYKITSAAGGWVMLDTSRTTYNVTDKYLLANASDAEGTFNSIDILSNGFKVRNSDASNNPNGGTVVYMAFAESPFSSNNRAR